GLQPLPPELHRELRTKLPEYMCPSTYMILAALPRTTTGKVNREALPSPVWERPEQEDSYVAPGNPIEEELARLWAEVLEIERVGVTDNFFAAGGHSLLAVRLLARISEVFQVELLIHDFFEVPTVAEQAATIQQKRAKQVKPHDAHKPAIKAVARDRYKTSISEQGVLTSSKATKKDIVSARPIVKAVARTQYKANISEHGVLNLPETTRESLALEKSEEE